MTEQAQAPSSESAPLTMNTAGAAISSLLERETGGPRDESGKFKQQEASPAAQPPRAPSPEEAAPIESESAELATDSEEEIDLSESTEADDNQPDIEMPKSWSSTDRDEWSKLTPQAKAIVLRRETQREAGMNKLASQLKAKETEVSQALQQIEQERQKLASSAHRYALDAEKKFQAEFGDVKDPTQLAMSDPAKFLRYQAATMALVTARQEAQGYEQEQSRQFERAMIEFRQTENQKLAERLKLDTPEKAGAWEQKILKAATEKGIPGTRLAQYTADELEMFDKALRYDAAVAKRQTAEKATKQPPKVVKPGSPSNTTAQEQQEVALMRNLKKSGKAEDAIQLLKLRMK